MQLVKPALDVGLYTNNLDPVLTFWQQQANMPFSELLPVGGGVHQHRHAIGDSVLKINHSRTPRPSGASGLAQLTIFSEHVDASQQLTDPDGNTVELHPTKPDAPNLRLTLRVNDITASEHFYQHALGLSRNDHGAFLVGHSEIVLQPGQVGDIPQKAVGLRYMTFQVANVVSKHNYVLAHGGQEGWSLCDWVMWLIYHSFTTQTATGSRSVSVSR